MKNVAKYGLQLFFDAFKFFLGVLVVLIFSPVILVIALPILAFLIIAFSMFVVILLDFLIVFLKIVLYIGIPAAIIYYILDHFDIV